MRQAGEQRLRAMLEQSQSVGNTYNYLYVFQLHRCERLISRTYPSTVDSSSIDGPSQQFSDTPMAYSFLPSLIGHDYRDPPTPVSLPSPSSTINANDFFETYVDDTLRRSAEGGTPEKSSLPAKGPIAATQTTPSIARTLATTTITHEELESPDPLAMPGPSPSKKTRFDGRASPVRTHSGLKIKLKIGNASSSSTGNLSVDRASQPIVRKLTPDVVINVKRQSVSPKKASLEEPESSADELDWGDEEVVDQDGDYRMSDPAFTSPSPTKRIEPKGSGRTGERDQRCMSIISWYENAKYKPTFKSSRPCLRIFSKNPTLSPPNYLPPIFIPPGTSPTSLRPDRIRYYRLELSLKRSTTWPGSRASEEPNHQSGI